MLSFSSRLSSARRSFFLVSQRSLGSSSTSPSSSLSTSSSSSLSLSKQRHQAHQSRRRFSIDNKKTTTIAMAIDSSSSPSTSFAPLPPASSAEAVKGLEPAALWKHFLTLSALPRPSKKEQAVVRWLKDFARQREGLEVREDAAGNVVIARPGSGGGEGAEVVCVQGHIDMVTEKDEGVEHDFEKDPILLRRTGDGHWLTATGTTLGADNGIGVAAALALLDSPADAKLPPLECLFTIDEETGLSGAFGLDGSMISAARLVNLDTEEWGELFVGCAGGGDTQITLPVVAASASSASSSSSATTGIGGKRLRFCVRGLMGGHSGINIGDDRGNAVILVARLADAASRAVTASSSSSSSSLLVSYARGGDKRNALAREATIEAWVPSSSSDPDSDSDPSLAAAAAALAAARAEAEAIKEEYSTLEKDIDVVVEEVNDVEEAEKKEKDRRLSFAPLDSRSSDALLTLLLTLPHGVIKRSHAVEGLVETSTNLASVAPVFGSADAEAEEEGNGNDENTERKKVVTAFKVCCSTRSSLMPALEAARRSIARVARAAGASDIAQDEAYPGWAADPSAPLVALARESVERVTGRKANVGAIHAGLECGLIKAKAPSIRDAVSFGPTIVGAHSPDERVDLRTVGPFYEAVVGLMERLADEKKKE